MDLDELLFLDTYAKVNGKNYIGGMGSLIGRAADLILKEKAAHLFKLYHHTKIEGDGILTVSFFEEE